MVLVLEEGSSQQLADAHCRVARHVVSKSNPHIASYDLRHDERGYNWRVETLLTDMNVLFSYVAQVNFFWLPIPEILWRTMNPVYVSITPGDVCATQALLRMSTGNKAEYEELSNFAKFSGPSPFRCEWAFLSPVKISPSWSLQTVCDDKAGTSSC